MKFPITVYMGPGMQIAGRWDDVKEFTRERPRYVSTWGRADSIYHWIGCIVRLRPGYWKDGVPAPYGVVVEVGTTSQFAALWADGHDPKDICWAKEMDCWHFQGLHDLKQKILARRVSEDDLLAFVRSFDESILIATR
jgi:hypothetical protein